MYDLCLWQHACDLLSLELSLSLRTLSLFMSVERNIFHLETTLRACDCWFIFISVAWPLFRQNLACFLSFLQLCEFNDTFSKWACVSHFLSDRIVSLYREEVHNFFFFLFYINFCCWERCDDGGFLFVWEICKERIQKWLNLLMKSTVSDTELFDNSFIPYSASCICYFF